MHLETMILRAKNYKDQFKLLQVIEELLADILRLAVPVAETKRSVECVRHIGRVFLSFGSLRALCPVFE